MDIFLASKLLTVMQNKMEARASNPLSCEVSTDAMSVMLQYIVIHLSVGG